MQPDLNQCYEILGLKAGATLSEVSAAHRDLVQINHPDRFAQNPRLQQTAQYQLTKMNAAKDAICEALSFIEQAVPTKRENEFQLRQVALAKPSATARRAENERVRQERKRQKAADSRVKSVLRSKDATGLRRKPEAIAPDARDRQKSDDQLAEKTLSKALKLKRNKARKLKLTEKIELVCAVLGNVEAVDRHEERVYVDQATDYLFRVAASGSMDITVLDGHERTLFHYSTATTMHDPEVIRAFQDEPHWLSRLEVLFDKALAMNRTNLTTVERSIADAHGRANGECLP